MRKQSILIPLSFPRKRESTARSFWIPVFTGMTLCLLVGLVSSTHAGTYIGGDGSPENPYQIATAEDMNEIGANPADWDAHFVMVNDINLADYTGTQFNIIGEWPDNPFTGVFDGNDHTISNFTYTTTDTDNIGIFGYVRQNARITDLTLTNPNVNAAGDSDFVGAFVGQLIGGTISGCGAEGGSVSGDDCIGGLVGLNYGTISDCYATGSVSGKRYDTGGLVGGNAGTVSDCYAAGSVEGDDNTGGLVGINDGMICNCYATGEVTGEEDTGGLVGFNVGFPVTASFWDIETSGQSSSDGGEGKTTAEMQTESTFTEAGWDFIEIWNIGEKQTYPFLRIYPAGDLNHDGRVDLFDFAIIASHWLEGAGQ
jgi:hypothetical protein